MNEAPQVVKSASRAGVLWGILTIILGIFAMGSPLVSGIAVAMLVAIVLIAAGISETLYAFQAGSLGQGILKFLWGGLTIIVGIVMVSQPTMALATLTMVLAVYFLIDGLTVLFAGFKLKPAQGWGWMVFNGFVTLALGWMIFSRWPISGVWAVGILVGVRLLFAGMTMIALGSAGGQLAEAMSEDESARINELGGESSSGPSNLSDS